MAFTVDEHGNMYVVENRGYPDPAEGGKPATKLGRITRLNDVDGDGIYDQRTTFAENLTYPNGIMAWKGGVFVTSAPDIFYFKDVDGDGVAEEQKVVLTGFFDTKTAQIRMSHPTLGLDGWIYVTGGLNGGEITSPEHPNREAVKYSSGDGRFNPDTYEFEVVSGKSQFGITIDAYGRRFGSSNRHPVMHSVIEPRYLSRNPHFPFNESVSNVSKVQAEAVVYPISGAVITADYMPELIGRSHQGTFTSASGLLVYSYRSSSNSSSQNIFICESAQSMVQRQVMTSAGATFTSKIARDGEEFLASSNEWFRPVFLGIGPLDGLYVVDMHRKVIDHPSYVPETMRDKLDYRSGEDMGRIYRVVNKEHTNTVSQQEIYTAISVEEIVQFLAADSEWKRATAYRLLLERKSKDVTTELRQIALHSRYPESRVKALWLLELLGEMDKSTIEAAMKDIEPGVREQAVQFAFRKVQSDPDAAQLLLQLADDEDLRVRFLTSLALGGLYQTDITQVLAKIAAQDGAELWSRAAVLTGVGDRMSDFLTAFRVLKPTDSVVFSAVMMDLGKMFGNGASREVRRALLLEILNANDHGSWRNATALGLIQGAYGRKDRVKTIDNPWMGLLGSSANQFDKEALSIFLDQVIGTANDKSQPIDQRITAISILGYTSPDIGFETLEGILKSQEPVELHTQAVQAFTQQGLLLGSEVLTSASMWPNYSPKIRSSVLSALISKIVYIPTLYNAIETGTILPSDVSSSDRQRLINHKDEDISAQAKLIFEDLESGDRMQIYESYRSILTELGDAQAGRKVFDRTCSVCHTYAGEGGNVGPDLTGVKNQPVDALLMHTIVPNYEVYPNYMAVTVEAHSGESLSGWIETESDHSITLRTASGQQRTILRSNIQTLTTSGRSLMPDGLEQTMTKTEMKDLITYLKSGE